MVLLAATDLDRTLIYSKKALALSADRPPLVCVEVHHGKDEAFMTQAAAETYAELAQTCLVVPVTTRIAEQYERVRLPGPPSRFAIAANGGVLYVHGKRDRAWSKRVRLALSESYPLSEVWDYVGHVCRPEWTVKLRNADDYFCYAVVHVDRLPTGFVTDLSGWAAERGWRMSLQGRKLYWVPERLTKSAAVAEVARRADADVVVAAGDSLLDVDFLLRATHAIVPRHGELFDTGWSAPHAVRTRAAGVLAGEEIVAWFVECAARYEERPAV
jgi:hypothetical protein